MLTNSQIRELKRANLLLAQDLGSTHGSLPNFQWAFSEPHKYDDLPGCPLPRMWYFAPDMDVDGNPIYDFHCRCGVNATIHLAECNFIAPQVRMVELRTCLQIHDAWILTRWIPPPTRDAWQSVYGSQVNYLPEGRYIPMGFQNEKGFPIRIRIPESNPPTVEHSKMVIAALRESNKALDREALAAERQRLDDRDWVRRHPDEVPPAGSKVSENAAKIRELLPTYLHVPGKKDGVSYPSIITP